MLHRQLRYITLLAPLVIYVMILMAGVEHAAFSILPVSAEVAKQQGARTSRPLSIAVLASQIAITASLLSVAVIFFASIPEPRGVSYLVLPGVAQPSTMAAIFCTVLITNFLGKDLKDVEIYHIRRVWQKAK